LSDALECLGLCSWIPGRFELTAPWGLQVATHLGWFYLIVRNSCLLGIEGGDAPVSVAAGDLIIVFQGREHHLRDRADSPVVAIQNLLEPRHFERREPLLHGGGGKCTSLLCGCFVVDGLERSPLRAALPAFVKVKGEEEHAAPYVGHIARLLETEALAGEPGSQSVINRLLRILLIKALQGYLSELPEGSTNWLRALTDPDIGRALGFMHAQPEVHWTVASLAERVAMARSTFAARFTEMVGKPPLEYLTQWRMQKACFLLRTTRARLKEVAAQVGYESTSAFSKAFAHSAGAAPGAYRRTGNTAAGPLPAGTPPL
jgi:AraC-like DNA-binding protein